jgi:CRP-like cAMP-binding protein
MKNDAKEILKHTIRLQPGEIIFNEGDVADGFYFVKAGKISIFRKTKNGEEIILNELNDGAILGELGVLDFENNLRTASAKCLTTSTLIQATKDNLINLIKATPQFADKIIKILVERFNSSEKRLLNVINQQTLESKLFKYLTNILLVNLTGSAEKLLTDVKIKLPYDQIVEYFNDSAPDINDIFKMFENYIMDNYQKYKYETVRDAVNSIEQRKLNQKYSIKII